jgi:hypothetical protein
MFAVQRRWIFRRDTDTQEPSAADVRRYRSERVRNPLRGIFNRKTAILTHFPAEIDQHSICGLASQSNSDAVSSIRVNRELG